jgi:hypothetical protein
LLRYKLRTLLVLLAVGPPMLSHALRGFGTIGHYRFKKRQRVMDLRQSCDRLRYALTLCVLFISPGMAFCQVAGQPPERDRELEEWRRAVERFAKARDVLAEHKTRNSLDRRIGQFRVKSGALHHAISGLHCLGVDVCYEQVLEKREWYVDKDGTAVFATDHLFAIDLKDASLQEVMDQICKQDARYAWTHVAKYGLIVLAPRNNSQLQFRLGAVKDKGNPTEVLQRIDDSKQGPPLANVVIRGDNKLPDVDLDVPSGTATELLNQIVAQHPGMTWGFGGRVVFSYVPGNKAQAVDIEFPEVTKGDPTNRQWSYDIAEKRISGVLTVTAQKRHRE